MNLWLLISGLYCLGAWLLGAAVIGRNLSCFSRGLRILAIATLPLTLPFMLFAFGRCIIKGIQRARLFRDKLRTFSDYDYQRLEKGQLAPEVADCFEMLTHELKQRGFVVEGDYSLRTDPWVLISRVLWHPTGSVWSSVCLCEDTVNIEFASVLKTGTMYSTASIEGLNEQPEAVDRLVIRGVGTLDIDTLLSEHLAAVSAALREQRTRILQFSPAQSADCIRYNHRLFYHWKHRVGECSAPPVAQVPSARGEMSFEQFEAQVLQLVLV